MVGSCRQFPESVLVVVMGFEVSFRTVTETMVLARKSCRFSRRDCRRRWSERQCHRFVRRRRSASRVVHLHHPLRVTMWSDLRFSVGPVGSRSCVARSLQYSSCRDSAADSLRERETIHVKTTRPLLFDLHLRVWRRAASGSSESAW